MRKRVTLCMLITFLICAASAGAALLNRAPSVLPGTDPQWRSASYWVSQMDAPDAVIMATGDILAMNEAYETAIRRPDPFAGLTERRTPDLGHWWPGYVLYAPDLFALSPREVAAVARERIDIQIEYLESQAYGNVNAIAYSDDDIARFKRDMALDAVPAEITPRRGLAVTTTQVRNVPTLTPQEIGLTDSGERRFDMFNVCLVHIGRPVTVLYPSRSGAHLLVQTEDAYGWVRSSDIAFGDEGAVNRFADPEEFVVATGDRVMYYSDRERTIAAGWFGMGDRLPRAVDNDPNHVIIPVRLSSGQLIYESAWLRDDALVHEGYLPYTRRNIVETAFRLMDNPYDFTNAYLGRNHETTYRDLFGCFGFRLPWHGALFTIYSGTDDVALPDPDNDSRGQFATILTHPPFVTLSCAGGHAQLLLGEQNGVPIVFDHHGYEYTDDDGTVWKVRRTCVGQMNNPGITGYMLTRPLTISELR